MLLEGGRAGTGTGAHGLSWRGVLGLSEGGQLGPKEGRSAETRRLPPKYVPPPSTCPSPSPLSAPKSLPGPAAVSLSASETWPPEPTVSTDHALTLVPCV